MRRLWLCWCDRILVTWLIRYILHQKYEISLVSALPRLLFMEFSKVNGDELFNCKSCKKIMGAEEKALRGRIGWLESGLRLHEASTPHLYLIWRMRWMTSTQKFPPFAPLATHLSRLSIIARAVIDVRGDQSHPLLLKVVSKLISRCTNTFPF